MRFLLLPLRLVLLLVAAPFVLLLRVLGHVPLFVADGSGRRAPLLVPLGLRLDEWRVRRGPERATIALRHKRTGARVMLTGSLGSAAGAKHQFKGMGRVALPMPPLGPLRVTRYSGAAEDWLIESDEGWLAVRGSGPEVEALVQSAGPYAFTGPALERFEAAVLRARKSALVGAATAHVFDVEPSARTAALRLVTEALRRQHVSSAATQEVAPGLFLAAVAQGDVRLLLRQVTPGDLASLGFTFEDWKRFALDRLATPELMRHGALVTPKEPAPNVVLNLFAGALPQKLREACGPSWLVALPSDAYFIVASRSEKNAAALHAKLRALSAAGAVDLSSALFAVEEGKWSQVP